MLLKELDIVSLSYESNMVRMCDCKQPEMCRCRRPGKQHIQRKNYI